MWRGKNMKKILIYMCLVFIFLSSVDAFPLSGGNGKVNATVFGTIKGEIEGDIVPIYVDIGVNYEDYNLVLVDDDDKFYSEKPIEDGSINGVNSCGLGWWTGWGEDEGFCREVREFEIPSTATIKRLRVEPKDSNGWLKPEEKAPFSINWEGIPEVSDGNVLIKFYGANKPQETSHAPAKRVSWVFELKITNNGTENKIVRPRDFIVRDQYGWQYPGGERGYWGEMDETQLLPGESMKFDLNVINLSPLSRPVELRYENLTMDISAWT